MGGGVGWGGVGWCGRGEQAVDGIFHVVRAFESDEVRATATRT